VVDSVVSVTNSDTLSFTYHFQTYSAPPDFPGYMMDESALSWSLLSLTV